MSCDPTVDGAGCNNSELDNELDDKFSTGTVSKCYKCEWSENVDGTVGGLPECADEVVEGGPVPLADCPKYADTACYWAASFHTSPRSEKI